MIPNPLLGQTQVPRQHQRIAIHQLEISLASIVFRAVQDRFHEVRNVFRAKGAHGNGQMQAVVEIDILSAAYDIQSEAGSILAIRKPRRNVHAPTRETSIYSVDPRINPRLADVNLLSATNQADDNRPIGM